MALGVLFIRFYLPPVENIATSGAVTSTTAGNKMLRHSFVGDILIMRPLINIAYIFFDNTQDKKGSE